MSSIRCPHAGVVVLGLPFPPARALPRVEQDCGPPGQGLERDSCVAQVSQFLFHPSFYFWKTKCLKSQVGHLKHCKSSGKSKCVFKEKKKLSSGVIVYFVWDMTDDLSRKKCLMISVVLFLSSPLSGPGWFFR